MVEYIAVKWYYWFLAIADVALIVAGVIVLFITPHYSDGTVPEGSINFWGVLATGSLLIIIGVFTAMIGVIIGLLIYYNKILHRNHKSKTEPSEDD